MEISEQEVIERFRSGDKEVYVQIFREHYKAMVAYAKKFVMDTEIARDLAQDVLVYFWEKRQKISIEKSVSSYLFRAVHNTCINHLRKESLKKEYMREFLINVNLDSYAESGHETVVYNDMAERIDAVIEQLPEQCRNIFRLSRFRGMKNKEIAQVYSISVRTVETQIYRALKVLKENLQPNLTFTASLIIIFMKFF